MQCPFCTNGDTKVLESRVVEHAMRRRRECLKCSNRFTTYENAVFKLQVLKKSGKEEPFNLQKLTQSIQQACGKVELGMVQALAKRVEKKVLKKKTNPIKTAHIGNFVLTELKRFNKIAYVRFATIYKEIEDPKELTMLITEV